LNIIITGATSMIGVATIESILTNEDNASIYAVVRPNSKNLNRLPNDSRIHIVECEAEYYSELPQLINAPCDIFYHFTWSAAGKDRNSSIIGQSENIPITLKTLTSAHELGCKKFIGAGSQAEYGLLNVDKIGPDSPVNPIQPYGIAKYAAGKLSLDLAEQYDLDCLWTRIFSIYGPLDRPTTLVSSAIDGLINNQRVSFTPAEQRWDYLYSSDAGKAFYLIGKKSTGRKVYCLGSGEARPLKDYIYDLQRILNPDCPVGIGDRPYPENCVMNLCADINDLQKDTGWKPEISFEEGIRNILEQIKRCNNK